MSDGEFKTELAVLVSHFLRHRYPEMYEKFVRFCASTHLTPPGTGSIEDALEGRFNSFPRDQFIHFIRCIQPDDDYPSIFRRVQPFPEPDVPDSFRFISPVKRVFCHSEPIYCLAVDPLMRILITGADDFAIKMWALPDLEPVSRFVGHEGVITNVCINRNVTLLLSSSHDKTVRLWSLLTGRQVATLSGFTSDAVHYAMFSPSGAMIVAACEDGVIPLWITGEVERDNRPCRVITTEPRSPVAWVTFSPGGEFLAYSCDESPVMVVALKSMRQWRLESPFTGLSTSLQFLAGTVVSGGCMGVRLMTVSNDDGHVMIWHSEGSAWRLKSTFRQVSAGRRSGKLLAWAIDADERLLVMSKSYAVYVCDVDAGVTLGEMPKAAGFEQCSCIAANPVFKEVFFFANARGVITIANVQERRILSEMKSADDVPYIDAIWSKDGKWIFAVDSLGSIASFRCFASEDTERTRTPPFSQYDMFEVHNAHCASRREFGDRKGFALDVQPKFRDIRDLDLPLEVLQQPFIREGVTEIGIINGMLISEDGVTPVPAATGNVAPPPLHISMSTEFPINPHGKLEERMLAQGNVAESEKDVLGRIQSDSEEWNLDCESLDETTMACELPEKIVEMHGSDIPPNVWPGWVTCTTYDERVYVPQVGDDVAFIGAAYHEHCRTNALKIPQNLELCVRHCKITDMESDREWLRISLMDMEGKHLLSDVRFRVAGKPRFMILWSLYRSVCRKAKQLQQGDCVVIVDVEDYAMISKTDGIVKAVRTDLMRHPYKCIEVQTDHDGVYEVSPWDLLGGVSANGDPADPKFIAYMHGLKRVLETFASNAEESGMFRVPNDDHYFAVVSFPMSWTFLAERVAAGYYRSYEAVIFDVQLFASNEKLLHGCVAQQQMKVIELSEYLSEYIKLQRK